MENRAGTGAWSYGGTLLAPAARAIVRDAPGILFVPLLLQSPLIALTAVEGGRLDELAGGTAAPSIWSVLGTPAPDLSALTAYLGNLR